MNNFVLDSVNGYHIYGLDRTFKGQKAVMVCLHGFAGDKHSSVIERLSDAVREDGIGTITFDWPAHGDSDAVFDQLQVENCIADLDTVVQSIRADFDGPIYCFATSFGGYLAMVYHMSHPDVFQKIILRSPALNMGDVFLDLREPEIREALKRGETIDFGFEQPLMVSIDFHHDLKKHNIFWEQVGRPEDILVIHGSDDVDVPTANSVDFCERNGIQLHIIEGCDHRYKKPGEVEEVIRLTKLFLK